jgi:hypothetical protein
MSNDLFQKVVDTVTVSGGQGGILSPEQSNRFIDYMWDATSLGQTVRKVRMRAPVREIDKMDLGQRIARHATEGIDDARNAGPTFSKIQLTTEKIRLDWELTSEALEDNIEEGGLEDHIARLMATQLGNDLEDLAINGDTDAGEWDAADAPLMTTFDGYHKRAVQGGATVLDAGGAGIDTAMFNRAYKALPRKFKARRGQLRFFIGSALLQDYHQALVALGIDAGVTFPWVQGPGPNGGGATPSGGGGATNLAPFGIPLYEVPLMDQDYTDGGTDGYFVLTHPDNHIWGVKREVKVYRSFAEKKDAIEYTVFTRQGVQIDNLDAYVVVQNIEDEQWSDA